MPASYVELDDWQQRELSPEPHTIDRGDRTWINIVLIQKDDELHEDILASSAASPHVLCAVY